MKSEINKPDKDGKIYVPSSGLWIKPKDNQSDMSSVTTNTAPTLPSLDTMSREELISTVARWGRAMGYIVCLTEEETAQAMLDVLAETALRPIVAGINMKADIQARMVAIEKWLDRVRGKPMQRIDMPAPVTNNLNYYNVPSNVVTDICQKYIDKERRKIPIDNNE